MKFHIFGVAALCLFFPCQWTAYADDDVNSDSYRSHPDGDGEPALASLTPEEKSKCIRELKRVEKRSRKFGIFLNRAKMERMNGNRLALVLASYDRFISILEEMPADFVKACRINSVWFSDEIVDMDGNHAGGIATGEGINLPLKFRKGTVYHEMFHKFECCISSSDNKEWLDCNPDEFVYTGSKWAAFGDNTRESKKARERRAKRLAAGKGKTVAEQLEKSKRKKDIAREAANKTNETVQAAFLGSYAQTTPLEDRACTFGTMMEMGPAFLDLARKSEHMKRKMDWMVRITGKYLGKDFWNVHSDITPELGEDHDYDRSPGDWPRGSPAELGFDAEKLGLLKKAIEDGKFATSALMIVSGGKVVFEHGDISTPADITTCWPSMLSLAYGKYVHIGKIDLAETLDAMGVSDVGGLVARERETTVRDIISSRSCCFHPAANDPPGKEQQTRGRLMPGNEFALSNWDFNVAATIFEKKTGRSFSEAFESDIVRPLAFQDWQGGAMRRSGRFDVSEHLPYEMSMSVRDMARVGELMLRNGRWKGFQLVPSAWIAESTARVSKFSNGGGFGYMWWSERQSPSEPALKGAFSARGLNAQRVVVLPALDMVVVHRASTRGKRGMKSADFAKLLDMAIESHRKGEVFCARKNAAATP